MKHLNNDNELIKIRLEKAKATLKGIKLLIESVFYKLHIRKLKLAATFNN